jgi:hypothetical protein
MNAPFSESQMKRPKPLHTPLSSVLEDMAALPNAAFSIADLRDALADRGFATLLFLFAAINLLPLPPGSSTILGLPPLMIAAQMIVGQGKVWLPDFILKRPISAARFRQIVTRLSPWLRRAEEVVKPRLWPFPMVLADRMIGIIAFAMSILLVAPIPFGNWLPALAIALYGLALSERDGVALGAAVLATLAALGVIGAIFGSAAYAAHLFMHI